MNRTGISAPLRILLGAFVLLLSACGGDGGAMSTQETMNAAAGDYPRGPHGARLFSDGDFAIELAIFETGVPPEFHAWAYDEGRPVDPAEVGLRVTLRRLDAVDEIGFVPADDYLRGTMVVYEPHSFTVEVEARYQGAVHNWSFDSIEGRTTISPSLKESLGIETAIAGPAVLDMTVDVTGRIVTDTSYVRSIQARFDGLVTDVNVDLGDEVRQGQNLLTIESNESLRPYTIQAPISGVVTRRNVNPGEQSDGRVLLELTDPTRVRAELTIFRADHDAVKTGAEVMLAPAGGGEPVSAAIAGFAVELGANQTRTARVPLRNEDGRFAPGTFVSATVSTGSIDVPLAVRREGLQSFRDFTVVYAKVGNQYEVRMLELGRQDDEMIEVLGGLEPGTEYVTANSYIIKADIEKSGASHDH